MKERPVREPARHARDSGMNNHKPQHVVESKSPFTDLAAAGFRHVMPVIPPGATISEYSKTLHGREDVLGKNPGRLVSDGWVGLYGWQKLEPTADQLAEWDRDEWEQGGSLGMRCHDVVAIDIDVTNAMWGDLIVQEAITHLGFGPTRTGNAPKRLMLYALVDPGSWPTKTRLEIVDGDDTHYVEVLGALQQFVVAGIHPKTGNPYVWDEDLLDEGFDGLTAVHADEIETFLTEVTDMLEVFGCDVRRGNQRGHDERDRERLVSDDADLVRRAVEAIPNEEDTDREFFVSVAHAVHGAMDGSEEGLEVFEQWADKWPLGQADGEAERVYRSAGHTSLGVQWLLDQARKHGMDSAGDDFGTESVSAAPGVPTGAQGGEGANVSPYDDFAADCEDANDDEDDASFWSRWVYVNRIKRFVDTRNLSQLDKENFNDLYHKLGDDQQPASFFMQHRQPQQWADDVDYRPGHAAGVRYDRESQRALMNMWKPGPGQSRWLSGWDGTAPTDEDVRPWLDLGRHLFSEDELQTLLDWQASLLQRPGVKPNWHPLVGSKVHGTGKDSFFAPLVRGLGTNVATIKTHDLEGQWTWWAENRQLVVVSEVNSFERRSVMNKLKSYMAAPPDTIEINKKGQPQFEVPNLFGMLMFTNNQDAMAIDNHDRRFYVVWSDAGKLDPEVYARYHEWLEGEGAMLVVRYLLARDVSAFNPKGNAPHTQAKEDMRRAALPQAEGLLLVAIEDEEGPFGADIVTVSQVRDWLKGQMGRPPSPDKLGVLLRECGAVRLGGQVRVSAEEGRQRLWAVRRGVTYLDLAEKEGGMLKLRDMMLAMREKASTDSAMSDFG